MTRLNPRQKQKYRQQYQEYQRKLSGIKETRSQLPPPQAGPQTAFLESDGDIVLYGGAAGSGKTLGLLLDFAQDRLIQNPEYGGVIFRRTYPQIRNEGGLWDESSKLYPTIGVAACKHKRSDLQTGNFSAQINCN